MDQTSPTATVPAWLLDAVTTSPDDLRDAPLLVSSVLDAAGEVWQESLAHGSAGDAQALAVRTVEVLDHRWPGLYPPVAWTAALAGLFQWRLTTAYLAHLGTAVSRTASAAPAPSATPDPRVRRTGHLAQARF